MKLKYYLYHSSLILFTLVSSTFVYADTFNESNSNSNFIWTDLFSSDVKASVDFYSQTFGWEVNKKTADNKTTYLLLNQGKTVARVVPRKSNVSVSSQALWVGYISAPDINVTLTHAKKLGAKVIVTPGAFEQHESQAIISDPQGGIVGIMAKNDHLIKNVGNKNWVWAQLFSRNPQQATQFYTELFGYTAKKTKQNQHKATTLLVKNNIARAAIAPLPKNRPDRNRWVGFISITNLGSTLDKAQQLGAEIIYAPHPEIFDGKIAVILDPNGALVGLIEQDSIVKKEIL